MKKADARLFEWPLMGADALCVGALTAADVPFSAGFDGAGFYLFVARRGGAPVQVIAKFVSEDAARIARDSLRAVLTRVQYMG
jgi:hypothetical protein